MSEIPTLLPKSNSWITSDKWVKPYSEEHWMGGQKNISKATAFPWNKLPDEIRLNILKNTEILEGSVDQSLRCYGWDRDGYFRSEMYREPNYDEILHLPTGLFLVSREMSASAYDVFFRHTRIVVDVEIMLELHIGYVHEFLERNICDRGIQDLDNSISFLAGHLDLSRLQLFFMAQTEYFGILHGGISKFDAQLFRGGYRIIGKSLQRLRGLQRLGVFLACHHDMEVQIEKKVMGKDYDSAKFGKIPHGRRDVCHPHRRLTSEEFYREVGDWKGGVMMVNSSKRHRDLHRAITCKCPGCLYFKGEIPLSAVFE
ncbi:hypothetical protein BP6252_12852 [Coleophoma cylindrospora]|uniref:F-box domain-containing protein n=1 Tax=Coleophoma cylindrospora TaxID=1849047 RepID=A0A3D8QD58_9HELO|nr:hypothetical protein BP6252_12852 [Coleophoma cylindrospora]